MDRFPQETQQPQQAASQDRAPRSAYEAAPPQAAPRRATPAAANQPETAPKFTDWASI